MDFNSNLQDNAVLPDFDFDSFLEGTGDDPGVFGFDGAFGMEGGEIGAD